MHSKRQKKLNILTNKKIKELMHGKKKRYSNTVYNYIDRTLSKPLARVHPGFVNCLCLKVVNSKLTMQTLVHAKPILSFFLYGLHALKIKKEKFN